MHAAWRKRAEEAEQENEQLKADLKDLVWSGCQTDQVAALVGQVSRQRTVLRELAEALKGMVRWFVDIGLEEDCDGETPSELQQARAALARAEEVLK